MWVYHSPIGPLYIMRTNGLYNIWYNNVKYGNYHSAIAAADDVFTFSTGCSEWDLLCDKISDAPVDLSEWEQC